MALFFYPFLAFAAGFLYLMYLHQILGIQSEGFGAAAAIVAFPMYSIPLFAFWLVGWEMMRAVKKGPMGPVFTLVLAVVVASLFGMMVAGTSGFKTSGGSNSFNYFFIGINLVGSIIHYFLLPTRKSYRSYIHFSNRLSA